MTLTAADISPGDVLAWRTWTGEEATATVQIVEPGRRISTDKPNIYWETTWFRDLDSSLASTRGLRKVNLS